MAHKERYDILIIGSGEAGKWLAWTMAQAGSRTAVVERKLIGGACPNIACLPSKNVIYSSKVAQLTRRAAEFGIAAGPVTIQMPGVRARKRQMVDREVQFHLERYKATGVELIMGEARFISPKTVEVATKDGPARTLSGERVFLNLGSHAVMPAIPGLKDARSMTHVEALELDRVPEHLVVLGGGFVGLELAQAMRRFGSRVTVLERGPQLLGHEDAEVCEALRELFEDEGIAVSLDTEVLGVERTPAQQVHVRLRIGKAERELEASDILVAAGRAANTELADLDKTGVELDDRGYIRVNERLETTAPGIWAMGDCAGSPHFTHVAYDDFRIVHANLGGGNRTTRGRLVPFCMFTDPELARVGLNESQARDQGIAFRVAKVPMEAVLRTHTISEPRGFLKALVAAESDQILGFTAFGAEAGEAMAVVQTAMLAKMPYTGLRDAILAHPTIAEGLNVLFRAVPARSRTGAA